MSGVSTPQKDTFHTPTEFFSKDKNDKIKSFCRSGSCGGLGGGPHRAEPDHVQQQTGEHGGGPHRAHVQRQTGVSW